MAKIEPYIILNMGTGSLEDALNWIEYCNGTGDTYWANLRRKHTGKDEAHAVRLLTFQYFLETALMVPSMQQVKYWGLGNEVWGEWQVGQQTAEDYATKARQWAHAIKLIDPTVTLIVCGETGLTHWDDVVLDRLADKVEMTRYAVPVYIHSIAMFSRSHAVISIHLYTGFGSRDRSQVDKEYGRGVYGPDAAEYCIEICKGLINKAVSLSNSRNTVPY